MTPLAAREASAAVRRPDQHPVHLRHHRLPQGRDAVAPQHPQQRLLHRPAAAATREHDRVCVPVPFYHCFGMVLGNLACTTHGATHGRPGRGVRARWPCWRPSQAERCTSLYGVPTMFIAELDHPRFARVRPVVAAHRHHGRLAVPGRGDEAVQSRMHMARGRPSLRHDGDVALSTQTAPDDPLEKRVGTVGRVQPHVEVKIVDPATGEVVPRGVTGRAVHARLHRDARLLGRRGRRPAKRSTPAGWMHTGDLATMDDDGYVEHRRPHQGHDHPRRREHLPARDRGVPAHASRASPRRRSSACRARSTARR